jgi:hypothetical protein
MKKVLIGLIGIILLGQVVKAQPVSDNAVIPMGITVSSILRLNVVSGGNIEFVFGSLNDFANGLAGDMYSTNFTVESSTDWGVNLYASSDFAGSAGTIPVGVVDYAVQDNTAVGGNAIVTSSIAVGSGKGTLCNLASLYTVTGSGTFVQLTNTAPAARLLEATGDGNDGPAAANNFYIRWRCGVGPASTILPNTSGAPLINDTPAQVGRSSTNVLVTLEAL